MKAVQFPVRVTRRFLLVLAASAAVFSTAGAQVLTSPWASRPETGATSLDPFLTTATRTANRAQTLGSFVQTLSAEELSRRQVSSLSQALSGLAGTPLFASGANGAVTSLFLRGANSNQTVFLVDGLRLNDPNTDYAVFLGGSCISACDSLEVAHGPQSTLYGGEAVGGVISLRADRGSGPPSGRIAVEAGSFGTVQGAVSAQGERGKSAYNFSAQGGHTDNDRPNNAFDSVNVTARVDHTVSERVAVGATVRWFHGVYGSPSDRFTNDPDNSENEDNLLATAFANLRFSESWTGRVTLGGQDRRFVAVSPRTGRATSITVVKNRRAVLDAQSTFTGFERHRVTAGVTAEANHTRNTGFGNINKKQSLLAFFAQDEFAPTDTLFLTAGLRTDDFDTFGHATTGRATAAWLVARKALKVRASYGTAFRSPGFLDLYGESAFYRGNRNLRPEKARGWDAGVDHYLPENRGTLSATWFETDYRDLIVFDFSASPSTTANVERARTRGLEISGQATLPGAVAARLTYTFLEAENLTQSKRLLRRPRHSASADVWRAFGRGVSIGVGASGVAQREDVHARNFTTIDGEDYAMVRVYGAWQVNENLAIKARLENLLDERYEEVHGFPALGFGAFVGVEWRF